MFIAYCAIAVLDAVMLTFSGILKLRYEPAVVQVVHDLIGVPLALFPALAACEFAGAIGLVGGIRWPRLGVAAAIGLLMYFVGAIASHLLVSDAGIGGAVLMLAFALVALVTRSKSTPAQA